jgi:hypothetical protein
MLRDRGGDLAAIVGREDECIEVLTKALELDPDDFRSRLGPIIRADEIGRV